MTVKTKIIFGQTYYPKTLGQSYRVKRFSDGYGSSSEYDYLQTPLWDQMKEYPQEAIEFFKKNLFDREIIDEYNGGINQIIKCIYNSVYYYESAEIKLNQWLNEVGLTKDQLLTIQYIPTTQEFSECFSITFDLSQKGFWNKLRRSRHE